MSLKSPFMATDLISVTGLDEVSALITRPVPSCVTDGTRKPTEITKKREFFIVTAVKTSNIT
jgi:hypothetical protein